MESRTISKRIIILPFIISIILSTNLFSSINLNRIALFTPQQRISTATEFSLLVKGANLYLLCNYTNDTTFWAGGIFSKFDTTGKVYFFNVFNADSQRLLPKTIFIDRDTNIVILSEHALYIYKDMFYTAQVLNVRKFTQDGYQISNFSDSSAPKNTLMSLFPIGIDNNRQPVVIQTSKPEIESISTFNRYDESGKFLKSVILDSTKSIYDSTQKTWSQEKFEIEGFTNGTDNNFYCYGNRQMLFQNKPDTLSAYIMAIDSVEKIKWKYIFYSGIITCCCTTKDGSIVFVGIDGKSFISKFDSQGKIKWRKNFGKDSYFVHPLKVIETSNGDFFIIGSAKTNGQSDKDKYIAKLNKDGDLIWDEKEGLPIDERFVCIKEFFPNNFYLMEARPASISVYHFVDNTTGIIEEFNKNNKLLLKFSPNPVENVLFLNSDIEFGKIEIFSTLGLKVLETEFQEKIDVSGLVPGIYYINLNGKFLKFIKI